MLNQIHDTGVPWCSAINCDATSSWRTWMLGTKSTEQQVCTSDHKSTRSFTKQTGIHCRVFTAESVQSSTPHPSFRSYYATDGGSTLSFSMRFSEKYAACATAGRKNLPGGRLANTNSSRCSAHAQTSTQVRKNPGHSQHAPTAT